jgi:urease accessory protein
MMPIAAAGTIISMADRQALQRLAWFSPAFPVGGYAYSHGLEKAVESKDVTDPPSLTAWIKDILLLGAGRNDAILVAKALRAMSQKQALQDLADLGLALALSRERRLETSQQGAAFYRLVALAWPHPDLPVLDEALIAALPYPVAVGMAGGAHRHDLVPLVTAYLQAFASNLMAAGLRLGVVASSEAQIRLASLAETIETLAQFSGKAGLDDLGGMVFRADLLSILHETQETRLFRS